MKCPKCKNSFSVVVDTRPEPNYQRVRKECSGCGHRYTIYELTTEQYNWQKSIIEKYYQIKQIMEDDNVKN